MNAVRGSMPRRSSIALRSTERLNLIGMSGRRSIDRDDLLIDWTPNNTSIGQAVQVNRFRI